MTASDLNRWNAELRSKAPLDIVRWDIEKGKELGRYPNPEPYAETGALVGDQVLLSRINDKSVSIWDAAERSSPAAKRALYQAAEARAGRP